MVALRWVVAKVALRWVVAKVVPCRCLNLTNRCRRWREWPEPLQTTENQRDEDRL
jgi:hypothetical protein